MFCMAAACNARNASQQRYGPSATVTALDKDAKTVTLADGSTIEYEALITTMPLDITLTWLGKKEWADTLTHRCALLGSAAFQKMSSAPCMCT